ncbi:hypothetical protein HDU88_004633 [Geranomyces variabilis]|nr:hypothetical protein HDU88_004633 [Geranomyces variabilis]
MSTNRSRYAAACILLLSTTTACTAAAADANTNKNAIIPTLSNIHCSPTKIPLGSTTTNPINITWTLTDSISSQNRSRGVVSWQLYAQNALVNITQDVTDGGDDDGGGGGAVVTTLVPLNGPSSVSELADGGFTTPGLDYYQYGPHGLVDYTAQPLCLQTTMPYGNVDDDNSGTNGGGETDPRGYSVQTFCPLDCKVVRPVKPFTFFKNLKFAPRKAAVGDEVTIKWNYTKGFNFPKTVGLSLSFSSDYFEVPPEFIITTHAPAARKSYTLTITPLLSQFILKNAKLGAAFPYNVYVMLTWPPQTDPLGAVVARDAFTLDSSFSSSSSSLEPDVATATSAEAEMSTTSMLSVAPTPTEPILCGRNKEHRC